MKLPRSLRNTACTPPEHRTSISPAPTCFRPRRPQESQKAIIDLESHKNERTKNPEASISTIPTTEAHRLQPVILQDSRHGSIAKVLRGIGRAAPDERAGRAPEQQVGPHSRWEGHRAVLQVQDVRQDMGTADPTSSRSFLNSQGTNTMTLGLHDCRVIAMQDQEPPSRMVERE